MLGCNIIMCRLITVWILFLIKVTSFGVLSSVTEPKLRDLSNGHTIIGNDIALECTVTSNKRQVSIEWNFSVNINLTSDRITVTNFTENVSPTLYIIKSVLKVANSKKEDSSLYYCRTVDEDFSDIKYTFIWVPVYGPDDHLIKFYNKDFDKTETQLRVFARAHPEATFYWLDKNNSTIDSNSLDKFTVSTSPTNKYINYESVLKFKNFLEEDFGNYTLIVENKFERKAFTILLNITGPPETALTVDNRDEKSTVIKCQSTGFPQPNITWMFEKCDIFSCFSDNWEFNEENSTEIDEYSNEENGLQKISSIVANISEFGVFKAVGSNMYGNTSSLQYIFAVKNGFEIFAEDMIEGQNLLMVETLYNENIEIICAVSLYEYYPEIKWYHQGKSFSLNDARVPIKGFDEYHIKNFDAMYSSVSVLKLNIDKTDEGYYFCKASTKSGRAVSRRLKVIAREESSLKVATNMQNTTAIVKIGRPWKFYCNVDGYPTPHIEWYRNDTIIQNSSQILIKDSNQTLAIGSVKPSDNGTYRCEISNRLNEKAVRFATLGAIEEDFDWLLMVIIILVFALIGVLILIAVKIHKERKLKKELEAIGLANFEEGAVEQINPELRLDDQAKFLPYDKKWEIPLENLILGKELGSGAFGVVVKGELVDFPNKDDRTTVAVKMVNKFAGHDCIKALASELKIMAHLGKHINIVNMIGACTKDITKKKLLVVVEYCSLGNLQDYILKNSKNFVDQRKDNRFDWRIGTKKEDKNLQYTTLSFSNVDSEQSEYVQPENGDLEKKSEEVHMFSQDFLIWAFQIAQGMEYLDSKKVLHGDLAARNVLLCDNNVIKIADFGLARSMYQDGIYKKKTSGPLPVKWLAVESIGENIFSSQSDVWSFGIVLWEIFSLAKTPYPGMPVDQNFYKKLLGGYRMASPDFATPELYEMMLLCWDATPTNRPTFTELSKRLGEMLEEPIKHHYLDMNGPYVLMNKIQMEGAKNGAPNYVNLVTSQNYLSNLGCFHNKAYVGDKTDASDATLDAN